MAYDSGTDNQPERAMSAYLSTRALSFPNQNSFMGALLIGCYIGTALYGLISHQMYRYFRMYPNDSKSLKYTVGGVWLLDTLHTILIMHACYYYLITNYFDPLALLDGVWSIQLSITTTGLMAFIVHIFFSKRVFKITRSLWVSYTIVIMSLVCLGFAIATTVISFREVSFLKFQRFTWLACTALGLNTAADSLITGSLCLFLQRSRTGFEKTDSIIDKLLLYVVNAGLLSIAYNAAVLICAATMNDNLIFIGMLFIISKLYSNSLLAVLNSRQGVSRDNPHGSFDLQEYNLGTPQNVYEVHNSSEVRRRTVNNAENRIDLPSRLKPVLDIKITREIHTVNDQLRTLEDSASSKQQSFGKDIL